MVESILIALTVFSVLVVVSMSVAVLIKVAFIAIQHGKHPGTKGADK